MTSEADKARLKALVEQQLNMDDHGIYILGRREDYSHVAPSQIDIDEKLPRSE